MADRNVLIIGGSGSTGAEAVRRFRAAGDNVVFTYHRSELQADDLRLETGAVPVRCDVKFGNSVKIAIDKALHTLGYIDVLICNAAVADDTPVTEIDETGWEEVIDTNLNGVFYCVRNVLPLMIQRKSGTVITVAACERAGFPGGTAYSASKAGVVGLTKALAEEVGPHGITVNCVTPVDPASAADAMMFLASANARTVNGEIIGSKHAV